MNFVTTNHMGGICNVMFKLSAAISLALDKNVDYIFSTEFLRPISNECPPENIEISIWVTTSS